MGYSWGKLWEDTKNVATLGRYGAAKDRKKKLGRLADDARGYGDEAFDYFGSVAGNARAAGQRIGGYYDRQGRAIDDYRYNRPTYLQDLYGGNAGGPPTRSRNRVGGGSGSGRSSYYSTDLLNGYGRRPGAVSTYAGQGGKGVTTSADWFARNAGMYGPTARDSSMSDRYSRFSTTNYDPGFNRLAGNMDTTVSTSQLAGDDPRLQNYAEQRAREARGPLQDLDSQIARIRNLESEMKSQGILQEAVQFSRGPSYQEQYYKDLLPAVKEQGAAEKFYSDELDNLKNNSFDYFAQKTQEDLQRSAAARGRLGSGRVAANEREAMADLRARQWAEIGGFAQSAQQAQLQRQGQGMEFAGGAEGGALGRRQLAADFAGRTDEFALSRERLGLDAALGAEGIRTDRLGQADGLFTRSAELEFDRRKAYEDQRMSGMDFQKDAARLGDDSYRAMEFERNRMAEAASRLGLDYDQLDLDKLIEGRAAAGDASMEGERERRYGLDESEAVGKEEFDKAEYDRNVAGELDDLGIRTRERSLAEAQAASDEARGYFKDIIDAEGGMADSLAGNDAAFETLALQLEQQAGMSRMDAQFQALEIMLQQAGIDTSFLGSFREAGMDAASVWAAIKSGQQPKRTKPGEG